MLSLRCHRSIATGSPTSWLRKGPAGSPWKCSGRVRAAKTSSAAKNAMRQTESNAFGSWRRRTPRTQEGFPLTLLVEPLVTGTFPCLRPWIATPGRKLPFEDAVGHVLQGDYRYRTEPYVQAYSVDIAVVKCWREACGKWFTLWRLEAFKSRHAAAWKEPSRGSITLNRECSCRTGLNGSPPTRSCRCLNTTRWIFPARPS